MRRQTRVLLGLGIAGLLTLAPLVPQDTWAAVLVRLSAEFRDFAVAGNETSTAVGVSPLPGTAGGDDGVLMYTKDVLVTPNLNVLFVTVSATGDTHAGAALLLSCRVNGAFCNPGPTGASSVPPGWIALQKHFNYDTTYTPAPNDPHAGAAPAGDGGGGRGDMHDNSIHYTWCTQVEPGPTRVEIRLATSSVGDTVFTENSHFYIDGTRLPKDSACVRGRP